MARIRHIKPEFFDNDVLGQLSFAHRLCYIGLWTQADREGRFTDQPKRLKARLFPYDNDAAVSMATLLDDLVAAGFLIRYEVDGEHYLCVRPEAWQRHQWVRTNEPGSRLPAPPNGDRAATVVQPRGDLSTDCTREGKEESTRGGVRGGEPALSRRARRTAPRRNRSAKKPKPKPECHHSPKCHNVHMHQVQCARDRGEL